MTSLKDSLKFLTLLIIVLAVVLSAQTALSQSGSPDLNFTVKDGFDGYVKDGLWTPLRILATNIGEPVEGEIRIKTNYPGEIYARRLNLPSQSQKEITLFAPLRGGDYTVEFVNDDGKTLYRSRQTPQIIAPYNFLVGVVASDPGMLNFLAGLQSPNAGYPVEVAHLSLEELPDQAIGLSSLDALVFNDVDAGQLTPNQKDALAGWVKQGGRLIVGGGPNASATVSGLSALLPIESLAVKTLPTLSDLSATLKTGLGNFVNQPIPEQGPYLAAISQPAEDASVDLYEQDEPFLLSAPLGQGKSIYFALDFGLAPMNGWAGNDAFWERLLDPLESAPPFYANYDTPRSINDALANIPGAGLPSPWAFLTYLCAYSIFLIPINYFVLKKLKRPGWAWITIPVLIILFTLLGYVGGFRARGGQAILRQISVVRQISGEASAAVETFIGLYSPVRDRYTLRFGSDILAQPTDGGSGYKGVKTTSSAPTTIRFDSRTELQNLWTDIGSMATALAHDETSVQPIELDLKAAPQGSGWRISGRIINHSDQTLEDAILLTGDYGVQLSQLEPGQTEIDRTLQQLDIQPYNDSTIWGESYYQLDDVETQINDQIIRSLFWSDYRGLNLSGLSRGKLGDTVSLVGWQGEDSPSAQIEVADRNVIREAAGLRIVVGQLAGE